MPPAAHSGLPPPRGIDVRLAIGAVAGWLAVIAGLGWSPSRVLATGLLGAGAGVALLIAARHGLRFAAAAALASFCVALVLIPLAARSARARDSPLAALARERAAVTATLTVSADPRPLAATGPAGAPRVAVDAALRSVTVDGRELAVGGSVLVLAPAAGWRDVLPGQRVRVDARLQPPLGSELLAAVLAAESGPELVGRPPWWQRAAGTVRASLRVASSGLPALPRGLLPGLIDGDTSGLDPVLAERFRIAGLTHLVAVSGTNCAIVVGAALLALRRFGAGPVTCAAVGLAVLVAFVVIARPSPSVLRAALMAAIALAAFASGRQRDGVPLLSAAVLGLLVWRPQLAVDAGFAMSVLATSALLLIAPAWAAALRRRRVPPVIAESAAVAAAAHVVTAPVVAAISGRVSIVAIPANMLAEPVVAVTTVLGFGAALIAPLWMGMGVALAQLAGWPCRWLVWDAEFFGSRHGATLPWPSGVPGGLALLAATLLSSWLARHAGPRRVLACAAGVALIVQLPVRAVVSGWPPHGWVLVACDVGQGDALVLPSGPGSAVVVDTGPDPVAVDRCLADLHVHDVPLLIISHYHLDHVGGVDGVFHGRQVRAAIAGPLAQPASGVEIVRDVLADHGLGVDSPGIGGRIDVGAVHLEVLAPRVAMRGTRSDPNNSSLVVRATVRGVRILLPGDAEIEAQQSMLAAGVDIRADVLKVPHHGSAYSDARFLAAVHARLAVISVGLHNDYGHPSPLLLAELAKLGMPVRRTDRDGDVAVVADASRTLGTVVRGTRASTVGVAIRRARCCRTACHDERVAIRRSGPIEVDDELPPVVLLVGEEEYLASRAVEQIAAAARHADADADVRERLGGAVEAGELNEMASPSLFGGRRVIVIVAAQDLKVAAAEALSSLMRQPADDVCLVLQHVGGAKGKAILALAREVGTHEISCARLTRPDERLEFVRGEVRRAGGSITPDAAALLLDAVGSDLRVLATAAAQLVDDSGGRIDAAIVAEYHRGRAEVTGFAVSDRAVVGDARGALETLRWALSIGVPHVVIADALADGVRSVARLSAAGRGNPYELAQQLGMPPWKVKRAQGQARGWTEPGLRRALGVVADLNADVKGAAADPGYALERAIGRLSIARAM